MLSTWTGTRLFCCKNSSKLQTVLCKSAAVYFTWRKSFWETVVLQSRSLNNKWTLSHKWPDYPFKLSRFGCHKSVSSTFKKELNQTLSQIIKNISGFRSATKGWIRGAVATPINLLLPLTTPLDKQFYPTNHALLLCVL